MGISLLKQKTFLPLFLTQFFAAFNDNAFKLAMLTLISYFLSASQGQSEHFQAIASGLFIAPFFLFSATAGQLADKFDKAKITRIIKWFELLLMCIGAYGLYFGKTYLLLTTLTGMGLHSTFFGPIKYAILPSLLPKKTLLSATAWIESSTFMAILLGTTLGSLSIGGEKSGTMYAIFLTLSAAFTGLIASYFIPKAPGQSKQLEIDWLFWRATKNMVREVIRNKRILTAVLTISWFWLVGAVILTKLPDFTNYTLRADVTVFSVFLALFSIGIGVGSVTINLILKGHVSLRYVPIAMLMLSVFACDLYFATPIYPQDLPHQTISAFFFKLSHLRIAMDLFFMAFCGGLFTVPLYTYLQVTSEAMMRSRTIAVNNLFNALFMVIGTVFVMILLYFAVPIPMVFFILGLLNVLAVIVLKFAI